MKRILSSVLAIIMLLGCLTTCLSVPTAAAPIGDSSLTVGNFMTVLKEAFGHKYEDAESYLQDQIDKGYMYLMARYNGYELYCNPSTGEVAYVNIATGQTMTSNPVNFSGIPPGKLGCGCRADLSDGVLCPFGLFGQPGAIDPGQPGDFGPAAGFWQCKR